MPRVTVSTTSSTLLTISLYASSSPCPLLWMLVRTSSRFFSPLLCCPVPTIYFPPMPTLLVSFSFCSPRSSFPLSIQYLQVPPAPECRQQTGASSRSIPCSSTWGLLGRKPRVHSFLYPTGAKTPPWPWPWPWSCFSLPGHVPEPAC